MQIYIENNVLTNRADTTAAGEFIAKQLPISEESVRQAEANLRDFKQKNNVVSIKDETGEAVKLIADLDSKIAEAQAKFADATAQSAALRDKIGIDPKEAITVSAPLSESTGVKSALEDLQKVENQLAVERSRFQEGHPLIANLESKRATLKALLQERIGQTLGSQQQVSGRNFQFSKIQEQLTQEFVKAEMLRSGAAKEVDSLLRVQAAYKQRLTILPQLEKTQRELERQLEAAQSTYEMLLKKLQEIRVTEKQNVGNARIIENALVPESPAGPSKNLNLAVAGVLGILLSVATILILEITDTSIRSVKQVRTRFGYKLLGMVPAYRKKATPMGLPLGRSLPEIPVRDAPWSPISEAYQMLQANLKVLSSDKAIQVIVVTSSVSKEGKSTVSANLAVAMAQVGRQVLLIDADMRCPFQHYLWELPNSLGLSDIILDEVEFRTAVKKVMPDLDVLTSGLTPPNPNPVALIDSKRMTSLMKDLSEIYDFVIIDTPPVSSAAETLILGQMTDGLLLVVQPGVVDSPSAAASKELLEQSSQHILGLVVNGVPLKNKQNKYGAKPYPAKKELTTWGNNMHMNRENADIKN
jgi:capsular exopolysaccharide synthesis family protein